MARSKKRKISRRVFIHRLTFFGGGVVLLGVACKDPPTGKDAGATPGKAKHPTAGKHLTFTTEEYALVAAACERVIPKDEDPGAAELGVPDYIDLMLQSHELSKMKDDFLAGAAALDRRAERMFKGPFASATAAQQDELLAIFKDSGPGTGEAHWYELLIVLTLEGLLGDPSYGGNKDKQGWALVGFSLVGHNAAEPPPGYDGVKHLHGLHRHPSGG